LVAALASWLDAKAHAGQWLVRIEDVDTPRCKPGLGEHILGQLAACGLHADAAPTWQSQRTALYQSALQTLIQQSWAYPCGCSRKDIAHRLQSHGQLPASRHGELRYPGTCRTGLHGKSARAWRMRTDAPLLPDPLHPAHPAHQPHHPQLPSGPMQWTDRRLGPQQQDLGARIGDFVLLRADGLFAYQLAVVVDDAAQGITHVVRGEDLADNTPRQQWLQTALQLPTPIYLHTPLVRDAHGEKLSKHNAAPSIATHSPQAALAQLCQAARVLGLETAETGAKTYDNTAHALAHWCAQWHTQWCKPSAPKPYPP
jgi:glutamyl-Q tRNA(Asp) synthetase